MSGGNLSYYRYNNYYIDCRMYNIIFYPYSGAYREICQVGREARKKNRSHPWTKFMRNSSLNFLKFPSISTKNKGYQNPRGDHLEGGGRNVPASPLPVHDCPYFDQYFAWIAHATTWSEQWVN